MPRYFMSGTPLEDLERMMMDPFRQVREDDQADRQEAERTPTVERRDEKEMV